MAEPAKKKKSDGKTPRQRFLDVGTKRVVKAIKAVRNLGNVSSRKSYDYSAAEWSKAHAAIVAEVEAVDAKFKAALAGKSANEAEKTFSFG